MIRLEIAPEPASFKENVREPGDNALALLAGRPLPHRRLGRPITAHKTVRGQIVAKTIDDFPYWQDCLDDLHDSYRGICAYYCFRVEKATLPHVDHFLAKHAQGQHLAYEWSNYRLACGHANTCKSESPDVIDPTQIQDGWFQLDPYTLDVFADPTLAPDRVDRIKDTITRLKLREGRALEVRRHAMSHFRAGRANLEFLLMDHPFLAKELVRQGIRTSADLVPLPPEVVAVVEPEL